MSLRSKTSVFPLLLAATLLGACGKDPEVAKREFLARGDRFAAERKYPEALIEYRNAVQQDNNFGIARRKLSEMYVQTGNLPEAFREGVRAADLLSSDVSVQLWAGQMLLGAGKYTDAQARAEKALALDSKNIDAQVLRANAMAGLKQVDEAVAAVEEAIRDAPERIDTYASLGSLQLMRGRWQDAEWAFRGAVKNAPSALEPRLALANFLWVAGQRKEAEQEFQNALGLDPKNMLAHRALAVYLINSGRPQDAEPHLKVVAEVSPDDRGRLVLADYYIAMRRAEDARRVLTETASSTRGGASAAKLRLAALGAAMGDRDLATRLVDEVLKSDGTNMDARLARVQLLFAAGDTKQALATVTEAVQADPRSARAQLYLGILRSSVHEDAAALAAFHKTLVLSPQLVQADLGIARIHADAGSLDLAEQFVKDALARVPGYLEANVLLGEIYLLQGNVTKAEPLVRALVRARPNDANLQVRLGQLETLKGNRVAARQAFERALAKDPKNLNAIGNLSSLDSRDGHREAAKARVDAALRATPKSSHLLLLAGRIYRDLGDLPGAERFTREAIDADPGNFEAYTYLGGLYLAQKRLEDGVALYTAAAQKKPDAVGPPTMIGILYEMQHKRPEARKNYERALAIDSRAPVAANNLSWMFSELGENPDMALQLAKTAKAGLPDNPDVDDTLGWAYYKKGEFSSAAQAFLSSIAKDPKNPGYHYRLGLTYSAMNDPQKARASLEKALALDPNFSRADEARRALAAASKG